MNIQSIYSTLRLWLLIKHMVQMANGFIELTLIRSEEKESAIDATTNKVKYFQNCGRFCDKCVFSVFN